MSRVKRSVASRKRRKKVLKMSSGFYRISGFKVARQRLSKALQNQYRDRRNLKRDIRSLWIVRINAALRNMGYKYSIFMDKLKKSQIGINRKLLATLAMENEVLFDKMVKKIMES